MKKKALLVLAFVFAIIIVKGQNVVWQPETVKALTSEWTGERTSDGRPKVSDELLERLKGLSMEECWGFLRRKGYVNQFENFASLHENGWQILRPEKVMTGRVVTAQFMPLRPDFDKYVQAQAKKEGTHTPVTNYAPIIKLMDGDIYVADSYGKMDGGTLIGDNLADAIYSAGKRGVIFNGSLRDVEGILKIEGFNGWIRGADPTGITQMMVSWINAPIRIGRVTVLPGDVALCKVHGITFIPAHLVAECVISGEYTGLRDQFNYWARATKKFVYINERFDVEPAILEKAFKEWLDAKKDLPMSRKELDDYMKVLEAERAARMKQAKPLVEY